MNEEPNDYVGEVRPRKITQADIDNLDCQAMYEYMKQHMGAKK